MMKKKKCPNNGCFQVNCDGLKFPSTASFQSLDSAASSGRVNKKLFHHKSEILYDIMYIYIYAFKETYISIISTGFAWIFCSSGFKNPGHGHHLRSKILFPKGPCPPVSRPRLDCLYAVWMFKKSFKFLFLDFWWTSKSLQFFEVLVDFKKVFMLCSGW